ncbi:MAG TPA: hypothetical protein VHO25_13685, partial [Polyangiaceae bacterium]|nr:hypothetical protein [Polyangiaceae bacterium]
MGSRQSWAEPLPKVAVQLETCEGLLIDQLNHFLDVELGERRAEAESTLNAKRIAVHCSNERVTLTAHFIDGEKVSRDLDRFEVEGRVGARLLALAIAELARRSPVARVKSGDEVLPQQSATQRSVPGSALVFTGAMLSSFDFAGSPFWGVTAGARSFALEPATLQLDLSLGQASRDFDLGEVTTLLGALTPRLGVGQRFDWGSVLAAAGYRVGVAHIAGSADNGAGANQGSISGVVSGSDISGHASWEAAHRLHVLV